MRPFSLYFATTYCSFIEKLLCWFIFYTDFNVLSYFNLYYFVDSVEFLGKENYDIQIMINFLLSSVFCFLDVL